MEDEVILIVGEPEVGGPKEVAVCPICLDTLGEPINNRVKKRQFKFEDSDCWRLRCHHMYCIGCLAGWIESKVKEKEGLVVCCGAQCKRLIKPVHVGVILSREVLEKFSAAFVEKGLGADTIFCPNKGCSEIFEMPQFRSGNESMDCPMCKKAMCVRCRVAWHDGLNCDQYAEMIKAGGDIEQAQLMALKEKMDWKQCPKCSMLVERTSGCNFMRCKWFVLVCASKGLMSTCSGEHFCYACGVSYITRVATGSNPHGQVQCCLTASTSKSS
ncbi:Zinc finger-like protein [Achlya hypogyna]|uniref:RBR-type E3 ubiquitin transferase n=1 Tax=Achlya hypogyna TaxID=1202772 RepID=A0A1V9YGK8_ACHHY|nr:Zinc finger-like protein [Achlya hypogyna]